MNQSKITVLFILFLLTCSLAFSQDLIIKKNLDSISAKVMEIKYKEISFKKTNNLNGPLYVLPKTEVLKIIFENGTSESYNYEKTKKYSTIEQTKLFLKEYIDKYCFDRLGKRSIIIEFEGDYIRFYWKSIDNDDVPKKRDLYDFSQKCLFHKVSKRHSGIAFINAFVPRLISSAKEKWSHNFKLIIMVEGHENAEKILKALKHYHNLVSIK